MTEPLAPSPLHLVGHRFPGGVARIAPYEAWLGHDAMAVPPKVDTAATPTLEPLWILVVALRGMGLDLAALNVLVGATPSTRVLFGELGLEQRTPLAADVDYDVSGGITGVSRHVGKRSGAFDRVDFVIDIQRAGESEAAATMRSSFLFSRGPVAT